MHVVDHHRRGIHRVGGWSRSLDLECPHVRFWVLARAIRQRQTGQEQHLLLIQHGTELSNVDTHGIDAVQASKYKTLVMHCSLYNCQLP